jgi:hypothetical protein
MNDDKLINKEFNSWTIIKFSYTNKHREKYYLCKCKCGIERDVKIRDIIKNNSKSCGCSFKKNKECIKNNHRHNLSNHKLYYIWLNMRARCYNENDTHYNRYGGRGIIICDEWKEDFKVFYDWSINNGFKDGLTIDRKNNDGDYTPINCRWVDKIIQANNRCSNRIIEAFGQKKTLAEWSKDSNYSQNKVSTIRHRIDILKWTPEDAISKPLTEYLFITAFNETKSAWSWSFDERCKIGHAGLLRRLKNGMSPEDAITKPSVKNKNK